MKFKFAVIFSLILHLSLFAMALFGPSIEFGSRDETVYYVDFVQMPGGGGGDGSPPGGVEMTTLEPENKPETREIAPDIKKSVKDLTVKKESPVSDSRMSFPEKDKKKKVKKKRPKPKEKEELVSVVRKDKRNRKPTESSSSRRRSTGSSSAIRIGTGSGGGTGSGSGGSGSGGFGGSFPYSYYIDTLKSKISSSWYSSLITPGLKGRFVAVVYFKILRNGRIEGLKVERGSGIKTLDLSSLRAVENASPFPPLPGDFPYRYLGVHFEFEWEK